MKLRHKPVAENLKMRKQPTQPTVSGWKTRSSDLSQHPLLTVKRGERKFWECGVENEDYTRPALGATLSGAWSKERWQLGGLFRDRPLPKFPHNFKFLAGKKTKNDVPQFPEHVGPNHPGYYYFRSLFRQAVWCITFSFKTWVADCLRSLLSILQL